MAGFNSRIDIDKFISLGEEISFLKKEYDAMKEIIITDMLVQGLNKATVDGHVMNLSISERVTCKELTGEDILRITELGAQGLIDTVYKVNNVRADALIANGAVTNFDLADFVKRTEVKTFKIKK